MKVEQRVQVKILGAPRPYSYAWHFDPTAGEKPLQIGDRVELPPNQVQEEGSSGTVIAVGTSYTGELKSIVRLIRPAHEETLRQIYQAAGYHGEDYDGRELPPPEDPEPLWAGFGEGDYS